MTSDHSVSSNNSFKSHLNVKTSTCFSHCSSCAKHGDFASARVMWTCKGDMKSTSGEIQEKTWKEPSTLTDLSFNGYSNGENLNVEKLVGNNGK